MHCWTSKDKGDKLLLKDQLESLWPQVQKPARYTGGELNQIVKDGQAVDVRFAFCFPDVYEVGMSHMGLRILYQCINDLPFAWCERVFAPWVDMEALLREHNLPLTSLESTTPLSAFDFVGFTLQYEMSYTNVLNMLDLGGIPLRACERGEQHPLIIAGGPCSYNPEPLAPFVDLFSIGEGEEALPELLQAYHDFRQKGGSRREFLTLAAQIPGFYVPAFYEPDYAQDGTLVATRPIRPEAPAVVQRRIIADFENTVWPMSPIVPYMDIVHDRISLEIFRGCTRGCRFCQAGIIYRPVRERSPQKLVEQAVANLRASGYDEISLSSLSSGDYSQLMDLIHALAEQTDSCNATISLPSLRIDAFAKDYMKDAENARKAGLTLAPEAGTQRLRDVINKNVTEDDLENSVRSAFESGWDRVKFYFMIGLPTETEEDLAGIAHLARKVIDLYRELPKEKRARKVQITVSTSSFVPKPNTPFQWCAQDQVDTLMDKQRKLKGLLRIPGVTYHYHDSQLSLLEAVIARGDRRVAEGLLRAWELGCRFDGWSDQFKFDLWMQAFQETGIDVGFYAHRQRREDETFPWDHISCGVSKDFLLREYHLAEQGQTTPDCRKGCLGCGLGSYDLQGVSPCV